MSSVYLHWAKTEAPAKYNLASSAIAPLRLQDLPVSLDELELAGAGPYGYLPLLEAIAARHGVSSDCVVTANGTSMANHLAMAALVKAGDEVLMEEPTYEALPALAQYLGVHVRRFQRRAEEAFALDPGEVQKGLGPRTRLIVITNLNNPTSALADQGALAQIGILASKRGAHVLVDEVYLDAAFDRAPRTAFALGEAFIVTSSLTKAYGLGGLRCGWILAQPELARRIWMLNNLFGVDCVHLAERLGVLCFKHLADLARRSRDLLARNWLRYAEFLASCPQLECPAIRWGTISCPRLRAGSVERLCEMLKDQFETSVVPGRFFGLPQHLRIGLGGESSMLAAGLERLASALRKICKKPRPKLALGSGSMRESASNFT